MPTEGSKKIMRAQALACGREERKNMSLKKTISTVAALAMSVSAFAGFAVTANAAGELSGSYSPTPPETDPEKDGFTFKEWVADEEDATVFNAVFEQVIPPEPVLPTASVSEIAKSTDLSGNAAASYMATFESENAFDVKGITWTVTKADGGADPIVKDVDLSGETTIQTDGSIVFGLVIDAGDSGLGTIGSVTAELK